jgi:hypothetical protein
MEHRREHFLKTSPLHKKLSTSRTRYTSLIMLCFLLSLTLPACKKQQPAPLKTKALSVAHPDYRNKYIGTYTVQCFISFNGFGQQQDSSFMYQLTVEKAKIGDITSNSKEKTSDSCVVINPVKRYGDYGSEKIFEVREILWIQQSGTSYTSDGNLTFCNIKFRNDSVYYERNTYIIRWGNWFTRLTGRKN